MRTLNKKRDDWFNQFSGYIILAGIIAVVAGFGISRILNAWGLSSLIPMGIGGGVIIGFSIATAIRNKWFSTEASKRKALVGTNVAVMSIFAACIFAVVGFLNNRHYERFDLTLTGKYSLSPKTKNILKNLDKPIVVTTLFNPGEMFYEQIVDILKEYAYHSDKIKVESVDPLRNRTKVEELAKRLKIDDLQMNTVVFECGEYSKHVPQNEVIERQYPFKFKGEESFTEAILNITQEKQTAVYFVTGHGERHFEDYDRAGISGIANALKRDNCRIAPLDILTTKKIPDDCDVLIVAGPTKAYLTEELNIIRNYLEGRGKLLLMLEPGIDPNTPTGFKTLLAEYGVAVRDNVVVYNKVNMPLFGIQTVAEIYIGKDEYAEHIITDDLKSYNTILFGSCVVDAAPANDQMPYQAVVLMRAPEGSWGEIDVADLRQKKPEYNIDTDVQGPVSLAIASQVKELPKAVTQSHPQMANDPNAKPQGARLVVFGDTNFASNEYVENPGNMDLFRNSVNWLAKKETQLGISAKPPDFRKATINPIQMKVIFWVSIAGIPLIPIVVGSVVWWKRRR
ncbi:MAG: Mucin 2 precursor [Candidatus Jettenia ecosi]|uniref:Mucin 2 n=1 Tax=Candidatus Jettenia ecosi TaxID=2494326 RepID=A0A533QMU9_9BACT|nr:MAG: Mucin 2 precursor [Candidatus Jettenia ecosi]